MFSEYSVTCPPDSGSTVERAYAKVNLFLHVGQRRSDGYHEVATLLQTIALHDRVEISWSGVSRNDSGKGLSLEVTADVAGVPRGLENLAGRAFQLLEPALKSRGIDGGHVRIHLAKRIPMAAGLGGGSANAAAVLRGINRSFGLGLSTARLAELGADIGSDVPACVYSGTMFCRGRGEKVSSIASGRLWWVLASAGGQLSAGQVYSAFDEHFDDAVQKVGLRRSPEAVSPDLKEALVEANPDKLAPYLVNHLEPPVGKLDPRTQQLVSRMKREGATAALVSGSGPTVAGLVRDAVTAKTVAERLRSAVSWVWWGPSVEPAQLMHRDEAS